MDNNQPGDDPRPKPPPWRTSLARKLLKQDIIDHKAPASMAPYDVYLMRSNYWLWKYENFRSNLNNLRKAIAKDQQRAADDAAFLGKDLEVNPLPEDIPQGYPRWNGSEAERLLKLDVDAGLHEAMSTGELRMSKDEYQEFPCKVFAKHVYQEVVGRLGRSYWMTRKKAKENHPKEQQLPSKPPSKGPRRRCQGGDDHVAKDQP
jgi:hypothetical protein